MCLITNKEIQVATEDITVYKELNQDLTSAIMGFQYKLNKLYKAKLTTTIKDSVSFCIIDTEYLNTNFADWRKSVLSGELTCYEEGFHSSISLQNMLDIKDEERETLIVECLIPRGTRYVEDFVGFIVSEQIIILKEVNDNSN